mmetsp:Transcript_36388/g.79576  ORF Transcript_36388/g.79576 Transcript_36388/m.79576 type:complete len:680 (+) Transcript_36388:56-2095(+)
MGPPRPLQTPRIHGSGVVKSADTQKCLPRRCGPPLKMLLLSGPKVSGSGSEDVELSPWKELVDKHADLVRRTQQFDAALSAFGEAQGWRKQLSHPVPPKVLPLTPSFNDEGLAGMAEISPREVHPREVHPREGSNSRSQHQPPTGSATGSLQYSQGTEGYGVTETVTERPEEVPQGGSVSSGILRKPNTKKGNSGEVNQDTTTATGRMLALLSDDPQPAPQPALKSGPISASKMRQSTRLVIPARTSWRSSRSSGVTWRGRSFSNKALAQDSARHFCSVATFYIPPVRDGLWPWLRAICLKILEWRHVFDYIMGAVILANAVCIGAEINRSLSTVRDDAQDKLMNVLENTFLAIYVLELIIRFMAYGTVCLRSSWVMFDFVLVVAGCTTSWIIAPLAIKFQGGEKFVLLRIFRLLRLARVLRLLRRFRTLWKLVHSLLNCGGVLASTACLLSGTLYLSACAAVELITKDKRFKDGDYLQDLVEDSFGDVLISMMTLFRWVTLDSQSSIYTPIIRRQPYLVIYFLAITFTVSVALVNLVTAILVEGALANAASDKEMERMVLSQRRKELTPLIEKAFQEIDQDGSGVISKHEVLTSYAAIPEEIRKLINPEVMADLFDGLDMDGSGTVDEHEFVTGILQMAVSDVPLETQQMLRLLRLMGRRVETLEDTIEGLKRKGMIT